jgi:pyruvate ferredoxin oxidoreductase gamma subunit
MGVPVVALCEIDDKPIRLREPVLEPDTLIVQDPTLFHAIDVFHGLAPQGHLLINTSRPIADLDIENAIRHLPEDHVCWVPATEIALMYVKRPVPNAVLLGALCALIDDIHIESVVKAIEGKFPGPVGQANITAAKAGYEAAKAARTPEKAHA